MSPCGGTGKWQHRSIRTFPWTEEILAIVGHVYYAWRGDPATSPSHASHSRHGRSPSTFRQSSSRPSASHHKPVRTSHDPPDGQGVLIAYRERSATFDFRAATSTTSRTGMARASYQRSRSSLPRRAADVADDRCSPRWLFPDIVTRRAARRKWVTGVGFSTSARGSWSPSRYFHYNAASIRKQQLR